jgi:hypothetical protein
MGESRSGQYGKTRAAAVLAFCGLAAACSSVPVEPAPVYMMNRTSQIALNAPPGVGPQPIARTIEPRRVAAQPGPIVPNPHGSQVSKQTAQTAAAGGGRPHSRPNKGKANAHRPNAQAVAARRVPKMIPLDEPAAQGVEPSAMPSQAAASSDAPRSSWVLPAPADDPAASDSRRSTP